MKKTFLTFALCLTFLATNAQTVFGKWKTKDENGKVESVIEIYKQNGKAYAKIVEITDPTRRDNVCTECKGSKKNKPILGMVIMNGLEKDGDEWNDGKILDPKSGKEYSCYIKLINKNKLKLRGYIGFAIAGRTEYWYR